MNFKELRYFITVAEVNHFGKAAEACFVSQPTLSMQLKKLETELGAPLFERNNKTVMLTDLGRALLPDAKKIVHAIDTLKLTASTLCDPLGGTLKLAAIPTIAPYLLPKITPAIAHRFPKLTLLLQEHPTQTILDLLHEGKLDAAILALPIPTKGLVTLPLLREDFYLAAPKDHPLAKATHVKIKALEQEPLLLLDEGHCLRDQTLAFCNMIEIREQKDFRGTSLETLRQMVLAKVGLTVMPKMATEHNASDITYIPFNAPAPYREIVLICRDSFPRFELIKQIQQLIQTTQR